MLVSKRLFAVGFIAGLVGSGVAAAKQPPVVLPPFDPQEVMWAARQGANSIVGSALLRTVGGQVRTCAGFEVNLVPDAAYSRERLAALMKGARFQPLNKMAHLQPQAPGYRETMRTTACDAQGQFSFENLPDGKYFVTTQVTWLVPVQFGTSEEGGFFVQLVEVSGGKPLKITITA